ncbi:ATP-binding protein [Arthrobacter sp. H5]|uniref:ATP-binding protein n=1 Tax=Arthrobacter sp. H5 TaxID=1267973 RepID=UPI0004B86F04|nr:ATP-binding protein [Arthrobacter sp. H5]
MDKALSYLTFNTRQFHEMSLRLRVVLSQLPMSITVAVLAIGSASLHSGVFSNELFRLGLIISAVILALCILIPWDRLPYGLFLLIPILNFVPVGMLRRGADTEILGVGLLAVFPVVWVCASGLYPRLALAVSFLGPLAMIWVPIFIWEPSISVTMLTQSILLPIILFGIAVTIRVMTASMMDQQRSMSEKDLALQKLLRQSAQRERLLDTTVNTVDVGLLAVDSEGHDILFNRRQREIHRLALPEGETDAAEKDLLIFEADGTTSMPPDRRPAHRAVQGEDYSDYLVRLGSPPDQRVLSTSSRIMRDDEGNPEGAVVAFNDVTELVMALNAKEEFVAMVSHELRTPLTAIVGYLEVLSNSKDVTPAFHSGLKIISRNTDRLRSLVDDLLTTASGTSDVKPVRTDFHEVVREAISSMTGRRHHPGVRITNEVPEGTPATCDPARLGQVLDNLLSNAAKYSPFGGMVRVRARRKGASMVCEVADEGMGMTEKDSAEVFSKFFRSSAARSAAIPGVGLGLAIVRSIIEEHGGTITCRSVLGKGSTFTFELPDDGGPLRGARPRPAESSAEAR